MTIHPCKFLPIVMLVLGSHAPGALAQADFSKGEQLHAQAVA